MPIDKRFWICVDCGKDAPCCKWADKDKVLSNHNADWAIPFMYYIEELEQHYADK